MDELIRRSDAARMPMEAYEAVLKEIQTAEEIGDPAISEIFGMIKKISRNYVANVMEAPTAGGTDEALLWRALHQYGEHAQVDVMVEEMAELTKALMKLRRAQMDKMLCDGSLVSTAEEEIADVQIMLDQMKLLFPGWVHWMPRKLERLERRIEEARRERAYQEDDPRGDAGDRVQAAGGNGAAVRGRHGGDGEAPQGQDPGGG